jgi:hypothetical protein
MNPLNAYLAQSIMDERFARADAHRRAVARPAEPSPPRYESVTIRRATPDDRAALERLAALEGRSAPQGRALVAEAAGHVMAATWLDAGATLADPFQPTGELVALLKARSAQLGQPGPATRHLRRAAARVTALARH